MGPCFILPRSFPLCYVYILSSLGVRRVSCKLFKKFSYDCDCFFNSIGIYINFVSFFFMPSNSPPILYTNKSLNSDNELEEMREKMPYNYKIEQGEKLETT